MRAVLLLLCLSATVAMAEADRPADALVALPVGATPVLEDTAWLSDAIGGRPTGSVALD